MITNANMTIFNRRYVSADRSEKFVPTQIKDVSYYSRQDSASGSMETKQGDRHTVRIPLASAPKDKTYIDETAYAALSDDQAGSYWTIQINSIVVKGLVESGEMLSETELFKDYPDAFKVSNYTDNTDRPSDTLKHWRIGGE